MKCFSLYVGDGYHENRVNLRISTENPERLLSLLKIAEKMHHQNFVSELLKIPDTTVVCSGDMKTAMRNVFWDKTRVNVKYVEIHETEKDFVVPGGNMYFEIANHGWPGDPD